MWPWGFIACSSGAGWFSPGWKELNISRNKWKGWNGKWTGALISWFTAYGFNQ